MTRHIPPILSRPRRVLLDLIIPLLAFVGMMEIFEMVGSAVVILTEGRR